MLRILFYALLPLNIVRRDPTTKKAAKITEATGVIGWRFAVLKYRVKRYMLTALHVNSSFLACSTQHVLINDMTSGISFLVLIDGKK